MATFFAMNGYGLYIWSAYGVTALMLVLELLAIRSRRRSVLAEARLTAPEDGGGAVEAAR